VLKSVFVVEARNLKDEAGFYINWHKKTRINTDRNMATGINILYKKKKDK
jgi:hypothetical protein